MPSRLNPYLSFDGDARAAMEFYQGVFGGTLTLNTFGDIGGGHGPADADKIMHGMLETDSGFTLMGADPPPGASNDANGTVSLSGDDAEELRGYWARLCDGGTVQTPLEKQMWGDEFGTCMDRFGVSWLVDIAQPRS